MARVVAALGSEVRLVVLGLPSSSDFFVSDLAAGRCDGRAGAVVASVADLRLDRLGGLGG